MSQIMEEGPMYEVAMLAQAVENLFRKLIRLLVGRMSLSRLQEMIRLIFIDESMAKLRRERPGRGVSLTKLALLTGLDTRTLAKIRGELATNAPIHEEERFLREMTPECSIIDMWSSNPDYLDADGETPIVLRLKGDAPSFESLVKETLSSRGVTATSLLERLEASHSVEVDRAEGRIRLLDRRYWPEQKDKAATLEVGLISIGNHVATLTHNLETSNHSENAFFERANWTHRLNLRQRSEFRQVVRQFLEKVQDDAISILAEYEEDEVHGQQTTAGIGLFYFEE